MHLQIIVGSVREGRRSRAIADWALELASARADMSAELVDLKEWDLPMFNLARSPAAGAYEHPLQQRWGATIARGDAYLFVTPEYNHAYTAALKNALDWLFPEWGRKPAGFIGYGGATGGARSVEQLRLVLIELRMAALQAALHIPDVRNRVDNGRFEASPADIERLRLVLDEVAWWGRALKAAR